MPGGTLGGAAGFTLGGDTGATTGSYRDVRDQITFDTPVSDRQTISYSVDGLGD